MKKLLACLLALMLPCCALADTYAVTVACQVSQEGLAELISVGSAALGLESAPFSEKWIGALATFLSGFSANVKVDDADSFDASLGYDGQQLISIQSAVLDGKDSLVSSLFPGLLLTAPADTELSDAWAQAESALADMNWPELFTVLEQCFSDWEQTLDITSEFGYFAGDAYACEGFCYTLRFDERDIGVLLQALSRASWPDGINQLMRYISLNVWEDEDALREFFLDHVYASTFQNRYSYVLRFVEGVDVAAPLCLSLLNYENGLLVSTLSAGLQDDRLDAVLGYGLHGQNVYLATTLRFGALDGEPAFVAKLWSDPAQEGYYAVSSDPLERNLQLTVAAYYAANDASESVKLQIGGPALWDASVDVTMIAPAENELITTVELNGKHLLEMSLCAFSEPDMLLPALDTADLQEISLSDLSAEDEQLLVETFEEGIGTFLMTMGLTVPAELIITLLPDLLF